jgi:hypothetical protein
LFGWEVSALADFRPFPTGPGMDRVVAPLNAAAQGE